MKILREGKILTVGNTSQNREKNYNNYRRALRGLRETLDDLENAINSGNQRAISEAAETIEEDVDTLQSCIRLL